MAADSPLILWSYAPAALLFAALALDRARRADAGRTGRAFVAALALTALWALAIAGIGGRDVSARVAESARTIGWLSFMFLTVRRVRGRNAALAGLYVVVAGVAAAAAAGAVLAALLAAHEPATAAHTVSAALRMMTALGALLLAHHLHGDAATPRPGHVRMIALALAVMWGADLLLDLVAWSDGGAPPVLVVGRGIAVAAVALLLAIAVRGGDDDSLRLSRTVAVRSLAAGAIVLYAGMTVLLTTLVDAVAGSQARAAQAAIVFGATAALLALVSTPWLRAWTRVKLAKHLFRHRYDYRVEWRRFTATLGRSGDAAAPIETRIVKAVADIVHAPAGVLLIPQGGGLGCGAGWRWSGEGGAGADEALVRHLTATARIVELDRVRLGDAPAAETAATPAWMAAMPEAWAIVPLIHGGALVAAILLTRPPVDRALDWEDFDLLRVAGRQAASYLAEERAHVALEDAGRFDAFNRRFAYIMHDIKNLVSQLSLVARNAERHADNPDFRSDMIATLNESADRMNMLLARLSQHSGQRPEPVRPVDVAALLVRIAAARRMQHPVVLALDPVPPAIAQADRLEQVLGHLIQNAVEASPPDVAVTLAARTRGDDAIAIEVIDRGGGMTPGFVRDQLFRPFVSSKPGGFGIGAFEARQLVHAMGGTIDVTSRAGEGSCFRILLPVAPALERAA